MNCSITSYDRFHTWRVRRFKNSEMVNFAIQRLGPHQTGFLTGTTDDSQSSIHNPRHQYQLAPNLPVVNLERSQPGGDGIVRAPNQHHMHQTHACQQRNNAPRHDLVLPKQLLRPHISPGQPHGDNGQGESGTPPGHQQCRIVVGFGLGGGRGGVHVTEDGYGRC